MEVNMDGKILKIDKKLRVIDLLNLLKLNREMYIITINGQIATHDEIIDINDKVRIIRVVSGG